MEERRANAEAVLIIAGEIEDYSDGHGEGADLREAYAEHVAEQARKAAEREAEQARQQAEREAVEAARVAQEEADRVEAERVKAFRAQMWADWEALKRADTNPAVPDGWRDAWKRGRWPEAPSGSTAKDERPTANIGRRQAPRRGEPRPRRRARHARQACRHRGLSRRHAGRGVTSPARDGFCPRRQAVLVADAMICLACPASAGGTTPHRLRRHMRSRL